jgi:hypothetical protein
VCRKGQVKYKQVHTSYFLRTRVRGGVSGGADGDDAATCAETNASRVVASKEGAARSVWRIKLGVVVAGAIVGACSQWASSRFRAALKRIRVGFSSEQKKKFPFCVKGFGGTFSSYWGPWAVKMQGEVSRIIRSKIRIFKNRYSRSSCIEPCPDFETEYTGSFPRSAPGLWVEWILGWVKSP